VNKKCLIIDLDETLVHSSFKVFQLYELKGHLMLAFCHGPDYYLLALKIMGEKSIIMLLHSQKRIEKKPAQWHI
jgi:hypothetical protein